MMRSLYSGVSGLKTHQIKMDVIGNNIANVNTAAFKASSIVFNELMSQTTQKASGPNAVVGTGGTNARQIGLGVKSGAINVNIKQQGSAQSTGNPFDIMITGENFFVVNNGRENFFTRDGSFFVDEAGNLAMTSLGYNVMGWLVDEETGDIRQDNVTALRIMSTANMTYPPEATSEGYMSGILDKNDTDVTSANGKVVNLNFFDALGYQYTAKFVFRQSGDVNQYSLELDKILDAKGNEVVSGEAARALFGNSSIQNKPGSVVFDDTNYTWADVVVAGETSKQLVRKANNEVVVDLSQMYDDGVLKARDEVLTWSYQDKEGKTVNVEKTVQECLDDIAAAYGYQGSTDEFEKLLVAVPDDDPVTVMQMLTNLANNETDPSLPTTGSFDTVGREFNGVTVAFDGNTGYFAGINGQPTTHDAILNLSSLGGNYSDIHIDFSEISMFDNKGTSTIGADTGSNDPDTLGMGSGRRLGEMIGVSIQQDGRIYASYDNGMTKLLGQIATAAFANASGLEKKGDNLYSATLNSGEFDGIGVDITANGGYMSTGQLEMSNVDLSSEFTEMITTQRGFQANSRIITVSDTLLEELTNLKR